MLRYIIIALSTVFLGTHFWPSAKNGLLFFSLEASRVLTINATVKSFSDKPTLHSNVTHLWITDNEISIRGPEVTPSHYRDMALTSSQIQFMPFKLDSIYQYRPLPKTCSLAVGLQKPVTETTHFTAFVISQMFGGIWKHRFFFQTIFLSALFNSVLFGVLKLTKFPLIQARKVLFAVDHSFLKSVFAKLQLSVVHDWKYIKDAIYFHCLCHGHKTNQLKRKATSSSILEPYKQNIFQDLVGYLGCLQVGGIFLNWINEPNSVLNTFRCDYSISFEGQRHSKSFKLLLGFESCFFCFFWRSDSTSLIFPTSPSYWDFVACPESRCKSFQFAEESENVFFEDSFYLTASSDHSIIGMNEATIKGRKASALDNSCSSSIYSEITDEDDVYLESNSLQTASSEYSDIEEDADPGSNFTCSSTTASSVHLDDLQVHAQEKNETHESFLPSGACCRQTKNSMIIFPEDQPAKVHFSHIAEYIDDEGKGKWKAADLSSGLYFIGLKLQHRSTYCASKDEPTIYERLQSPLPPKILEKLGNMGAHQKGILDAILDIVEKMQMIEIPPSHHLNRFRSSMDIIGETTKTAGCYAGFITQLTLVEHLFEDCRGVIREINESYRSLVEQIPDANTLYLTQTVCHELSALSTIKTSESAVDNLHNKIREAGNLEQPLCVLPDVFNSVISKKFRSATSLRTPSNSFLGCAISSLSKIIPTSDDTTLSQDLAKFERIRQLSNSNELSKSDTNWCRTFHNRLQKYSEQSSKVVEESCSKITEYALAINKWFDHSLFRLEQLECLNTRSDVLRSMSRSDLEHLIAKHDPDGLILHFFRSTTSYSEYSRV